MSGVLGLSMSGTISVHPERSRRVFGTVFIVGPEFRSFDRLRMNGVVRPEFTPFDKLRTSGVWGLRMASFLGLGGE